MGKSKMTAINKNTGEIIPLKKANIPIYKQLDENITITDDISGAETKIILSSEQQQAIEIIFSIIASGKSMFEAVKNQSILNLRTIYNIINIDADYRRTYAQANEERERVMFESTFNIAVDTSNDMYMNDKGVMVPNPVAVQRARLQCDVIDKMLARMNHKKYGQKSTVSGDKDNPIVIQAITGMIID